jgi:DNA replication protein DnaC
MLRDTYIKNARIPKRYLNDTPLTPSKADEQTFIELNEIKKNIKDFVDKGENLLICSNQAGNGKTSWAIKLLKAYIDEVQNYGFTYDTPALFINVNSFLNEKKLGINDPEISSRINKIEKAILTSPLVVFDDIADKSLSEFDLNLLYYWLDYRTANMKTCIYTTNELPEQLKQTLNGKLYSRVVNYSQVKYITDGDNRKW